MEISFTPAAATSLAVPLTLKTDLGGVHSLHCSGSGVHCDLQLAHTVIAFKVHIIMRRSRFTIRRVAFYNILIAGHCLWLVSSDRIAHQCHILMWLSAKSVYMLVFAESIVWLHLLNRYCGYMVSACTNSKVAKVIAVSPYEPVVCRQSVKGIRWRKAQLWLTPQRLSRLHTRYSAQLFHGRALCRLLRPAIKGYTCAVYPTLLATAITSPVIDDRLVVYSQSARVRFYLNSVDGVFDGVR